MNVTGRETATNTAKAGVWPFRLTLLYFIFEYGRPMDLVPLLAIIRPMMILTILLVIVWITSPNKAAVRSRTTTWFALFLGWLMLHGPFSLNTRWAFYIFQGIAQFLVVYLCIITFIDSPSRLRKFHTCILIVTLFLAVQGIRKHGRVGSFFLGDENDFCLAMNVLLPFSFFPLLEGINRKKKILSLIALLVCVGAVVYSFSRGGFVGLLAVGLYCFWKSPRKVLAAVAIALLVLSLFVFAGKDYWTEMHSLTDETDPTRQGRLDTWKAATRLFLAHPLGVGAGSFPFAVYGYDQEYLEKDRTIVGRAAHSLYFTLLPELGVPGIVIFVGLVVASFGASKQALRRVGRSKENGADSIRVLSLGASCSLVAFLVTGAFLSVAYYPHIYYIAAIAALCERHAKRFQGAGDEAEPGDPKKKSTTHEFHKQPHNRGTINVRAPHTFHAFDST